MLPLRNILVLVAFCLIFQLVFLIQVYSGPKELPNHCDCSCSKPMGLADVGHRQEGRKSSGSAEKNPNGEHNLRKDAHKQEQKINSILDAEDRQLDKEIKKNKTVSNQDADELNPYEQEKADSADLPDNKTGPILGYDPMNLNPEMDDSRMHCDNNSSDILLIYVYTAPKNFHERSRVRRTWGSVTQYGGKRIRVVFFLGDLSPVNKNAYEQIKAESREHGDIVQDLSYVDAYRNLTLKGISALQWVSKFCPDVYRVFKVDDDTMLNPYQLIKFLSGQSDITMSEIICKVTEGVGPLRNPHSKYYVSKEEYSPSYYPPYCQGYGYIIPPYVVPKMLEGLQHNKIIAMEDVYLTGLTKQSIGVRLHSLTGMFATTFQKFDVFLERIISRPELFLIGHVHEDKSVEVFWELIKNRMKQAEK